MATESEMVTEWLHFWPKHARNVLRMAQERLLPSGRGPGLQRPGVALVTLQQRTVDLIAGIAD